MTGPASASRRRNPALLLIAACFAISAAARLTSVDVAKAIEAEEGAAPKAASEAGSENADALLAAIRRREAELDERMLRLAEKERVLEAAEVSLRQQMGALAQAEARLSELVQVADKAADEDVAMLVAAFQNMDGKRAAPIFESMDVAFAAGLISRMSEAAAADILGALSPEKAYSITVSIASRNARAPRD